MKTLAVLIISLATGVLAGCSKPGIPDPPEPAAASRQAQAADAKEVADVAAMAADPRLVVVHKTESCGCCHLWVEHLQESGFKVTVRDVVDLGDIKKRVGVPYGMGSCHTARVGGYFVEGHVPATDIVRLLEERPDAKGLTAPGMPLGSPGMEVTSGETPPYDVHLVARDGSTSVFAHHGDGPARLPVAPALRFVAGGLSGTVTAALDHERQSVRDPGRMVRDPRSREGERG